jgi:hypothetical protein
MDAGRFVDAVRSGHDHPTVAASAKLEKFTHIPATIEKPKPKVKRGKK